MAVNIHNLIAAINPDIYCSDGEDGKLKDEVKKIVKDALARGDKDAYLQAAEKAKSVGGSWLDEDVSNIGYEDALKKEGLGNPINQHVLEYDAFGESLEPVYFWLLDKLQDEFKKVEKLSDNFVASPGSSYYSEMGIKATTMQNEASKLMAAANTVLRSILNLIYDLKEMRLILDAYEKYGSDEARNKEAGLLALKQKWMDQVDIKRGNGSLKGFAQQFDYVTIIDAFMTANSSEDVENLDLNDRVKRILLQRVPEFLKWVEESSKELKKRYEIEKAYLKSQVNALKMYSRWAKPYLKAAKALEQTHEPDAALVTTFNTVLLELLLFGVGEYDPEKDLALPNALFKKYGGRDYMPILILDLKFRSMPERISQSQQGGYGFRGRVTVEFTSYALNEGELKVLKKQLEHDDFGDMVGAIEGATDESLAQIQGDVDELLGDKESEEKSEEEKVGEDTNPFSALLGMLDFLIPKKKEVEEFKLDEELVKDDFLEEVARSQALISARAKLEGIYTAYKKAHKMVTPT